MTTQTQHTPGPWRVKGSADIEQIEISGAVEGSEYPLAYMEFGDLLPEMIEANAAFIVTACNAHDKLVADNARLRTALRQIVESNLPNDHAAFETFARTLARAALAKVTP